MSSWVQTSVPEPESQPVIVLQRTDFKSWNNNNPLIIPASNDKNLRYNTMVNLYRNEHGMGQTLQCE